jgi:3-oxo-5-alpha-steroid 4-dehydrogenase 3
MITPERVILSLLLLRLLYHQVRQNSCHYYLSTLPSGLDYKLPSDGEFAKIVCPHYGSELAIYHSICMMGFGWYCTMNLNWTIVSGYSFVLVNLLTTASRTKYWYIKRYGKEKVEHKALIDDPLARSDGPNSD